ncbi:hypothetical protein B0O99DRAFT_682376 [Bisporella sp. PMI_857]|nr:hypothetical protein B0O99DRAFT_682376 [Bisporella sp. PMI_857]
MNLADNDINGTAFDASHRSSNFSAKSARLPCLNAIIQERLRLCNPIPGELLRIVPSGGTVISNRIVSDDAFVNVYPLTLSLLSPSSQDPISFIPSGGFPRILKTVNLLLSKDDRATIQPFGIVSKFDLSEADTIVDRLYGDENPHRELVVKRILSNGQHLPGAWQEFQSNSGDDFHDYILSQLRFDLPNLQPPEWHWLIPPQPPPVPSETFSNIDTQYYHCIEPEYHARQGAVDNNMPCPQLYRQRTRVLSQPRNQEQHEIDALEPSPQYVDPVYVQVFETVPPHIHYRPLNQPREEIRPRIDYDYTHWANGHSSIHSNSEWAIDRLPNGITRFCPYKAESRTGWIHCYIPVLAHPNSSSATSAVVLIHALDKARIQEVAVLQGDMPIFHETGGDGGYIVERVDTMGMQPRLNILFEGKVVLREACTISFLVEFEKAEYLWEVEELNYLDVYAVGIKCR